MSRPATKRVPGLVYAELWEGLWDSALSAADLEFFTQLPSRLHFAEPDDVTEKMRHVAERFKAGGHSRPPAVYLVGILGELERVAQGEYEAQWGPRPERRGGGLTRAGESLLRPRPAKP